MLGIINSLLKDAWMFFGVVAVLNVLAVLYKIKNKQQ